jgi:hypothetical protein
MFSSNIIIMSSKPVIFWKQPPLSLLQEWPFLDCKQDCVAITLFVCSPDVDWHGGRAPPHQYMKPLCPVPRVTNKTSLCIQQAKTWSSVNASVLIYVSSATDLHLPSCAGWGAWSRFLDCVNKTKGENFAAAGVGAGGGEGCRGWRLTSDYGECLRCRQFFLGCKGAFCFWIWGMLFSVPPLSFILFCGLYS